ncbi:hypothetical protein AXK56_16510 [Tsukamurella pulmonis]|nr:hypothetical protein AXK56_16510 [Tsukamurella pulmonis]
MRKKTCVGAVLLRCAFLKITQPPTMFRCWHTERLEVREDHPAEVCAEVLRRGETSVVLA